MTKADLGLEKGHEVSIHQEVAAELRETRYATIQHPGIWILEAVVDPELL